jgi:hypothetical protein
VASAGRRSQSAAAAQSSWAANTPPDTAKGREKIQLRTSFWKHLEELQMSKKQYQSQTNKLKEKKRETQWLGRKSKHPRKTKPND